MSRYVYSWSKSYAVAADVAGPIIQRAGSAVALVDEAAKATHPLHSLFTWDDTHAAREYRLVQARVMINSLRVEVVNVEREVQHVPAFVASVKRPGAIVPILEATRVELTAAEKKCWQQMQQFRDKWGTLQFAREVVAAIDTVAMRLERSGRAPKRSRKEAADRASA